MIATNDHAIAADPVYGNIDNYIIFNYKTYGGKPVGLTEADREPASARPGVLARPMRTRPHRKFAASKIRLFQHSIPALIELKLITISIVITVARA